MCGREGGEREGREGRKEVSLSLSFEVGWAETWGSSRIGQRERKREAG